MKSEEKVLDNLFFNLQKEISIAEEKQNEKKKKERWY